MLSEPVISATFWEIQPLSQGWGVRSVGLVNLDDTPEARDAGLSLFLLSESRVVPGVLAQTSPPKKQREGEAGKCTLIDLDLSRYDVIARRFDRSVSWVSRRLSLVRTLPAPIQQHVRDGAIVAHAAMKYLVPLARAKAEDGVRFATAIAPHRLTTRQIGRLYQHYLAGPEATRELVLGDPLLVLRLTDETTLTRLRPEASAPEALLTDLHVLGAIARRAARRLQHGGGLLPPDRARAWRVFEQAQTDFDDLHRRCEQELRDARSGSACRDSESAGEGRGHPADCPRAADLPWDGPDRPEDRQPDGAAT